MACQCRRISRNHRGVQVFERENRRKPTYPCSLRPIGYPHIKMEPAALSQGHSLALSSCLTRSNPRSDFRRHPRRSRNGAPPAGATECGERAADWFSSAHVVNIRSSTAGQRVRLDISSRRIGVGSGCLNSGWLDESPGWMLSTSAC